MDKCRVSIEERNNDPYFDNDETNQWIKCLDIAKETVEDGEKLELLIVDHGLHEVYNQLARCLKEFDNTACGDQISLNACLNALSTIQKIVMAEAINQARVSE